MSLQLVTLWQYNVEFTILLAVILLARYLVRKTTRVYNAYLLWASIPLGILLAGLVSLIEFSQPPIASVNVIVTDYVVSPVEVFLRRVWRRALQHITIIEQRVPGFDYHYWVVCKAI